MKYKKIFLRLRKQPVIFKEIYHYLKNDLLTLLGRYRYDYRILYVDGLIKSGSSWLGNMLAMIPGYNLRPINDPDGVIYNHDVCDSIFSSLPKNRYSVMKLHTKYSDKNLQIIKKYMPKFVVTYRDLRDVCIARYSHVIVDPKHHHHRLYTGLSREEGIFHCIDVVKDMYVPWVKDWMDAASRHKDMVLTVKYEDLNKDTFNTLKKIMEFYNIRLGDDFVHLLASTKIKEEKDLGAALRKNLPGKLRSTARKGVIGDWKNYFNDRHKEEFKEIAGNLLIKLGYEKDYDW